MKRREIVCNAFTPLSHAQATAYNPSGPAIADRRLPAHVLDVCLIAHAGAASFHHCLERFETESLADCSRQRVERGRIAGPARRPRLPIRSVLDPTPVPKSDGHFDRDGP